MHNGSCPTLCGNPVCSFACVVSICSPGCEGLGPRLGAQGDEEAPAADEVTMSAHYLRITTSRGSAWGCLPSCLLSPVFNDTLSSCIICWESIPASCAMCPALQILYSRPSLVLPSIPMGSAFQILPDSSGLTKPKHLSVHEQEMTVTMADNSSQHSHALPAAMCRDRCPLT